MCRGPAAGEKQVAQKTEALDARIDDVYATTLWIGRATYTLFLPSAAAGARTTGSLAPPSIHASAPPPFCAAASLPVAGAS
ncbi:uncharacterized [Tachysurus ichikawai]